MYISDINWLKNDNIINCISRFIKYLWPHFLSNNVIFWKGVTNLRGGIRQWPINWGTTQMRINKITPYLYYNWWLNYSTLNLITHPINIQWKYPKLFRQQIRKSYHKTLGTSVNKQPKYSPPCLGLWRLKYSSPLFKAATSLEHVYQYREKIQELEK